MSAPIDGLVRLGLTEYEAKAYVAMVTIGEGGINDISQQSGIPRSRVYDVMERLAKKGFVEVGAIKPLRYRAVDPDQVVNQIWMEHSRTTEMTRTSLKEIRRRTDTVPTPLWFILGERRIDVEVKEFVGEADAPLGIIALMNGLLLKYAPVIAEKARTMRIDAVVANEPERFRGILGKARLMRMPELETTSLDWMMGIGFPSDDWDRKVKVELLLISGGNSLLVFKEDDTRRAIRVEGSIIGQFVRTLVDGVIQAAEPLERERPPGEASVAS